jgi:hypothetical protein
MNDTTLLLISALSVILPFGIFIYIGYFVDKRNRRRERLRGLGVGGKQTKNLIK